MSFFSRHKEADAERPQNREQALFRDFRDLVYIFVIFLVIYVLFFRIVTVEGSSMHQTLLDGDRVFLISRTVYQKPKQGDIIVVSKDSFRNGECIVKRVIAVEGQTVDIDFDNRIVYVDGQPLQESYVYFKTDDNRPMSRGDMSFPLLVKEGCVFVMGDNRNVSLDSRDPDIGQVDLREILGRAVFILIPGTDGGKVAPDYSRIGGI